MSIRSHIKRNARHAVSGSRGALAAGTMLTLSLGAMVLITGQLSLSIGNVADAPEMQSLIKLCVNYLLLLAQYCVLYPLWLGHKRWSYMVAGGEVSGLHHMFFYFSGLRRYGKAVSLGLQIMFRMLLWTFVCTAPAFGLLTANDIFLWLYKDDTRYGMFIMVITFLFICGMLVAWVLSQRYFAAGYILFERPDIRAVEALRLSALTMRGRKTEIAVLYLSWFLKFALCALVIPALIFLPEMETAKSMYGKYYARVCLRNHLPVKKDTGHTQEIKIHGLAAIRKEGELV